MGEITRYRSSSNIESSDYDKETDTLSITFSNGSTYEYSNVPPAIHRGLQAAGSAGSFFRRAIMPRFSSEQVG